MLTREWSETGLQKVTARPACPFLPILSLPGFFYVHNSAGTAETTTLPGDVAVFNSMGKDKDISASASVPSHVFLKWSTDTPLLSDPVVLETGIQRPGRMSNILNVLNVLHSRQPRERGLFWWQDKSISSDRSLCSRVNVVQKDELLPPLTLIPIRWKIKLISFRGEWGRGWRRAEQSVKEMWQGRRQPGLRVAGRRSGKDPEREGTRNKLNCLEMTLVWNIFHYWKFLSIIIYVLFII